MKTQQITIGDRVTHSVPSMMYNQTGIVIGLAGTRYGRKYLLVSYTNPKTNQTWKTPFWEAGLKKA